MNREEFLGYADIVYDWLLLAVEYWPITLILAMYFTMAKTWEYYLALMHLKKEQEILKAKGEDFTKLQKIFGYPMLIRGLVWDWFLNFFVGSILFFEPPRYDKKEWLFTGRVSRWKDTATKRGKMAILFCREMLNPFDKGHCD